MVAIVTYPKYSAAHRAALAIMPGKTFKLGIVINAIWQLFRNSLQTKEKPDPQSRSGKKGWRRFHIADARGIGCKGNRGFEIATRIAFIALRFIVGGGRIVFRIR
ncbi:hypothetical protein [Thalassospira lucentensis]|uniref:hypothetical protein n=1 Tax=Thalassospira lucentensis TaxID=168935 RepID=UPI003D2C9488